MQAQVLKQRLVSGLAIGAVLVTIGGCSSEQSREAVAVNEFHQRLAQGRVDLIYSSASEFAARPVERSAVPAVLWPRRAASAGSRSPSVPNTIGRQVPGGPELVLAFYNSRYAKRVVPRIVHVASGGTDLKLATYSCARNMQVSCPGGIAGSACETSPVPGPRRDWRACRSSYGLPRSAPHRGSISPRL